MHGLVAVAFDAGPEAHDAVVEHRPELAGGDVVLPVVVHSQAVPAVGRAADETGLPTRAASPPAFRQGTGLLLDGDPGQMTPVPQREDAPVLLAVANQELNACAHVPVPQAFPVAAFGGDHACRGHVDRRIELLAPVDHDVGPPVMTIARERQCFLVLFEAGDELPEPIGAGNVLQVDQPLDGGEKPASIRTGCACSRRFPAPCAVLGHAAVHHPLLALQQEVDERLELVVGQREFSAVSEDDEVGDVVHEACAVAIRVQLWPVLVEAEVGLDTLVVGNADRGADTFGRGVYAVRVAGQHALGHGDPGSPDEVLAGHPVDAGAGAGQDLDRLAAEVGFEIVADEDKDLGHLRGRADLILPPVGRLRVALDPAREALLDRLLKDGVVGVGELRMRPSPREHHDAAEVSARIPVGAVGSCVVHVREAAVGFLG